MLGGIVERAGDSWLIDDLLVGFKYIANVLKTLEEEGQYQHVKSSPDSLVLAAEESHGVMMVPIIRDKDAAPACSRQQVTGCALPVPQCSGLGQLKPGISPASYTYR